MARPDLTHLQQLHNPHNLNSYGLHNFIKKLDIDYICM